jgi:hypothetical protein
LYVDYSDAFDFERLPVRRMPARHAEPLPGYSVAILKARIPHVFRRHIGETRKLARHPLRVRARLLNPQIIVFAVSGEFETEFLGYLEVLRCGANSRRKKRSAKRSGPVRK